MTLDQIIGILGQSAIWITVILVFLTLREMEKQRKASQKPELIIPNMFIIGYPDENCNLYIASYWSNKEVKKERTEIYEHPNVTIYNIGAGAAKEINFSWNFDVQNTVKSIQDYCYSNSIPVVIRIQNNYLEIGIEGGFDAINLDSSFKYSYLMPTSVTSQGLNSEIPIYFLELISFLIFISMQKHGFEFGDFEFPSLFCELSYTDIGGVRYIKKFDVTFNPTSLSLSAKESGFSNPKPIFQGILKFKEIKAKKYVSSN
jgi:hypothetical protein